MNILVAMPDRKIDREIRENVCSAGHVVLAAATAKEALSLVSCRDFGLAFVHLGLPGGDGRALIFEIKRRCPDVPVVAMAASNTRNLELSVRNLGVIYYMLEPFDAHEMAYIVEHLASRTPNHQHRGGNRACITNP